MAPVPAPSATAAAPAPGDPKLEDKKADASAKEEAKKAKQKELRAKEREVEAATVEQQVAALDRTVRQWTVDDALAKAAAELARANLDLETFLAQIKPRELEEKRIGLDQSTHRAEHSKDELGELTAMYEADEFARTTKELVLKRGRRELEMAERYLAVAKKEVAHFESVAMPQRERELRQKVTSAELERKKAEVEAQKVTLEFAQALKKEQLRRSDLQEEIADLQKALATEKP